MHTPSPTTKELMEQYEIKEPNKFYTWSKVQQLDYIAERILANNRKTKSHQLMKEEGYLSRSQMERRRDGETYSAEGNLEALALLRGVYSRAYRPSKRRGYEDSDSR